MQEVKNDSKRRMNNLHERHQLGGNRCGDGGYSRIGLVH